MTTQTSTIEVHRDGAWIPAADLTAYAEDRCRLEYRTDYVFSAAPWPIALGLPVEFDAFAGDAEADRRPPPFLYDLVPQGKGRAYLVKLLGLADSDRLVLPLLNAGAFNPIGALRIDAAVQFFRDYAAKNPDRLPADGLTMADIERRTDGFLDHVSLHGMLATGTTGVQGVAPKFLLTQDRAGRWFADSALADEDAVAHWLLKLPRGKAEDDKAVLRNEAAYLHLARVAGLRALPEDGIMHRADRLFVRRFDRLVVEGQLHRLHQESLASLAGLTGFAPATSQNQLLYALRRYATEPVAETLEFIKRDVLNLALRNTDNHARNTAVQRLPDGRIQLTPLFDFCPMFRDPEIVPRSVQWRDASGQRLDTWQQVLDDIDVPPAERSAHIQALREFASTVGRLPEIARDWGVDKDVLAECLRTIEAQAEELGTLED